MDNFTDVHWHEGMFLRPHHLQVSFRDVQHRLCRQIERSRPWSYGVRSLEINTSQLAQFRFDVDACEVLFRDGTWLCVPANAQVEARNFKFVLERQSSPFLVSIGIPQIKEREPNVSAPNQEAAGRKTTRYTPREEPFTDMTTGRNEQMIQTLRLNAQIFFEGESVSGYDLVPVARIQPAGTVKSLPTLDEAFVPPVLTLDSFPSLYRLARDLTYEAQHAGHELAARVVRREAPMMDGAQGGTETALKLQSIYRGVQVLRQMIERPLFHPQDVYYELLRLIGDLAIFLPSHRLEQEPPIYDHEDLGTCFQRVSEILRQLLEAAAPRNYEFRKFERRGEYLEVELDPAWFDADKRIYIAVRTDRSVEDVRGLMDPSRVKVASPNSVARAVQDLVYGLRLVMEDRLPLGLPDHVDTHYFGIEREPATEEYWEAVVREKTIAVAGAVQEEGTEYWLYVLLKPERPRRSK